MIKSVRDRGYTLVELMMVMTVVTVLSVLAYSYLRPADDLSRVSAFIGDLQTLRSGIKRSASASGDWSQPYAALALNAALPYNWGVVPPAMADTDTTRMMSPWNTRIYVRVYPLMSSAGATIDTTSTAFNLRIEMPQDRTTRKQVCAPLVTGLAALWPQMAYGGVGGLTSSNSPGTIVISTDLPATANRIATIVNTVCSQNSNFILVVADA